MRIFCAFLLFCSLRSLAAEPITQKGFSCSLSRSVFLNIVPLSTGSGSQVLLQTRHFLATEPIDIAVLDEVWVKFSSDHLFTLARYSDNELFFVNVYAEEENGSLIYKADLYIDIESSVPATKYISTHGFLKSATCTPIK